jgi:cytidylate kinase
VEERARRRFEEIKEKGEIVSLDDLKKRIIERDRLDETRAISPLKKAKDAVLIDSTQMSIEDVTETILSLAQKER